MKIGWFVVIQVIYDAIIILEGLMEHLTEVNEKRRAPEVGSVHGNH